MKHCLSLLLWNFQIIVDRTGLKTSQIGYQFHLLTFHAAFTVVQLISFC